MIQLFKNKQQAFWILQVSGWLGWGFIRYFNGLAQGEAPTYAYWVAGGMVTGFLMTLLMRAIYRNIRAAPLPTILGAVAISSALLALVFSIIEVVTYTTFYDPSYRPEGLQFLGTAMFEIYVLLAWSAIYFGVNYYLQAQEDREKTLKAIAMAHQAQLKMLRYQLNPHFLFNTLNAISTLVLDKDSVGANNMLGRLSSFLRYTLVNQPTNKVALEQELYALGLYLDIEKVRFEDHLRLVWEIDDAAKRALMPSLLLQPMIENAIKYAVATSEDGGMIAIQASVEADRLILKVCDDGPGLDAGAVQDPKLSSGVGIANTRERLVQIYGDDHSFELRNREPSGLEVVISIPCELATPEDEEGAQGAEGAKGAKEAGESRA